MSDLRSNAALAQLREKLAAPTPLKASDGPAFSSFDPKDTSVAINEHRLTLYVPLDFAQMLCSDGKRPGIKHEDGVIWLVREPVCSDNKRRVGSKAKPSEDIAFAFEYSHTPDLKAVLSDFKCSKSSVKITQAAHDTWAIWLKSANLRRPRKFRSSLGGLPGRVIKGAIEVSEEQELDLQAPEPAPAAPACAPAQPELSEQSDLAVPVISISAVRTAIQLINTAKDQMGGDLWFNLDEDNHLHATLHLI